MNLVIVESPTKAKTISKFLGTGFVVRSSFGHIRDLPKAELGVDVDNGFTPKYVIPTKSRKVISELKKEAAQADTVILATDEDREGEAISWHLTQALGLGSSKSPSSVPNLRAGKQKPNSKKTQVAKPKNQNIERIVFHEITERAIKEALEHPRDIDQHLVDAQQARRILDRLVGYKLSPFLWKKVARGLSAGRVQSVAVRLVVEREREIEAFKPEEYWTITALLDATGRELSAQLAKIGGAQVEKFSIKTEAGAQKIVHDLSGAAYTVMNVEKKEMTRSPFAPFTTSTLQQAAAQRMYFSAKQTMRLAQQLYEAGHITYMRTDSVNLSQESLAKATSYITETFGKKYHQYRTYKTKSKSAQEAHEAIRPTNVRDTPEALAKELDQKQTKLYELIWRRFTASQMAPAVFDMTGIDIEAQNSKIKAQSYVFRANGSTMKFDGFLKVYPTKYEENELPVVAVGEKLQLKELKPEQHFTKPPARYSEATLIKALEKEGIGRPSTYAPTLATIQDRNYVNRDKNRYLHPTEIGILVNDLLVQHFPEIVDVKFTSKMEDEFDEIAAGNRQWVPVIQEFYEPFQKNLDVKYKELNKSDVTMQEKTGQKCDKCEKGEMVVKMGRYGKFTACSNFPECKNILKSEKTEPEKTGEICDKCNEGEMVIRTGRFGKFKACSRYPKCKNTKKITQDGNTDTNQ